MDFEIESFSGDEISLILHELAQLRITIFREYPYLYDGSLDYEKEYLNVYLQSPQSRVWIVRDKGKAIGATTSIPLKDENEDFHTALRDNGLDIKRIFYFGESILLKQYRGRGIGRQFFKLREEYAKAALEDIQYFCFAAIERDEKSRPVGYRALDQFWEGLGYVKYDNLSVSMKWKDLGQDFETSKKLKFWLKKSFK